MYEDRIKKLSGYESLINKKKQEITKKKLKLEMLLLTRLKSLLKKFDISELNVYFQVRDGVLDYENCTPYLIVSYKGYEITIGDDGEIYNISNWYGVGEESRNKWSDYVVLLGVFMKAMTNRKPIYNFLNTKLKELNVLYLELVELKSESDDFEEETNLLISSKNKTHIYNIIREGMEFNFGECYLSSLNDVSSLTVTAKKDKTYLCSVFGIKYREMYSSKRWHDIYVKHNDLHTLLLNHIDSCGNIDFKRQFNLEITLEK